MLRFRSMSRPSKPKPLARSERLNLCLTSEDRKALEIIAKREDRDLGYTAAWFVTWGIKQYLTVGASLVYLSESKTVHDDDLAKRAQARLVLRRQAHAQHENVPDVGEKEKRLA